MSDINLEQLAKLRAPFEAHHISKLPKESKAQSTQRKADQDKGIWPPKCQICGGFHHVKAEHLDYVGHAALTLRLLEVDPLWTWEPLALGQDGLPVLDRSGGLWIKLTVCGMTRNGYGSADGKAGGDAVKELIGDALRNAAMRFGAALDLWHKGELHVEPVQSAAEKAIEEINGAKSAADLAAWWKATSVATRAVLEDDDWKAVEAAKDAKKASFSPPPQADQTQTPFDEAA